MERTFTLERITFEEFNRINAKLGRHSQPEDPNKAYFRILNEISYHTLAELLIGLDDKYQKPRLVWFRDGNIKMSEARRQVREDRDKYYQMLIKQQAKYSHLVAELSSAPSQHKLIDILDFRKINGAWVLTNFYIRSENSRFYHFNAQRYGYGTVMLGIYPPNEPVPSKAGNPIEAFFGWFRGKLNQKS